MLVQNQFEIGQVVYLKTDVAQYARLITSIIISPSGILYNLSLGESDSKHYAIEISETRDEAMLLKAKEELL